MSETWYGIVPSHWTSVRFKDFLNLVTERSTSLTKVGLENIESGSGRFIHTDSVFEGNGIAFKKNDLLYGKLRPYLQKVYDAEFDGNAVGDIFVFRCLKNSYHVFVKYLLLSDYFTSIVNSMTAGAKMPRVSSAFILGLPFCLPPINEQYAIGDFLEQKSNKINKNIQLLEQKKEYYLRLKDSLINRIVCLGLDPNAKTKDSGLEWIDYIPSHWEIMRIKDIGKLKLGKMLTSKYQNGLHLRKYLKARNIGWGKVILDNLDEMFFTDSELNDLKLKKGDLLFTEGGEVGKTSIWNEEIADCYIQNSVQKLTVNKDQHSKYFLYLSMVYGYKKYYDSIVNLVSIKHLTNEKLRAIKVIVPPFEEQVAIANYLDEKCSKIDTIIEKISQEIELLDKLKKSLINEVITGKRTV